MINFDLISDLHVETWKEFDWSYRATSPVCVVAGDVSRDINFVHNTLSHLSEHYKSVLYIDGNDEHRWRMDNLEASYRDLKKQLKTIKNCTFLQNNCVIINDVAILGTNGWFGFDFMTPELDLDTVNWFSDTYKVDFVNAVKIAKRSKFEAGYLYNSVAKLQDLKDAKKIVIVTHTVPKYELVSHDIELENNLYRLNSIGNSLMQLVLDADRKKKISTWCFGHYHKSVDTVIDGVRYVSNCRGRGNTPWNQSVFHPLKIDINL